MSETRDREQVVLTVDPHAASQPLRESVGRTFDVVVIGDFSGGALGARGASDPPEDRRAVPVRSVDDALARLRPSVELDVAGMPATLSFEELEDFHPDRLVRAVPALRALVDAIGRGEPSAPGAVPARPASPGGTHGEPTARADATEEPTAGGGPSAEPRARPASGLLDDIVQDAPDQAPARGTGALEDLKPWLRDVVAPYLQEESPSPDAGLVEDRTAGASNRVRDLLHDPAVQGLERVWRSLFLLLRAVDPVEEARLHLLDLSRADLETLLSDGEAGGAPLVRVLHDAAGRGGGPPVALLVVDCAFGPEPADVLLLNRLAMVAHSVGAPLLAEATPRLLGLRSYQELPPAGQPLEPPPAWAAFRETEAAASVALLAPRVLLREPYGPGTEPCETFDFSELDEAGAGPYLWGSPAFLAAAAAVEALAADGWGLTLEAPREMDGLPIHVAGSGGTGAHPTEAVWPLDMVERAFAAGVNPVIGLEGQTRVRLPGLSSASGGRAPLRSWW